jgi:hypothetical protein
MTRRALVLLAMAACCRAADPAKEVLDLFTDVAASLSAGNVARFMAAFDPAMPGYAKLRESVSALAAQGDVQSSIDPVENEGTESERDVEWRWTLRIRRGQDSTASVQREESVKCKVAKRAGKWRITELEPLAFFAPVR